MLNLREIQSRIKSIKETKQITNAMYMISSSKVQKAKQALSSAMPYFETLQDSITCILRNMPDIQDVFLHNIDGESESHDRCAYIIITADKGLAGAYNLNVLKSVSEHLKDVKKPSLYVVGEVGRHYFMHKGIKIVEDFGFSANKPTMNRARRITEIILDRYEEGKLDEVYIIYTKILENGQCETVSKELLPLHRPDFEELNRSDFMYDGEIQFYPSIKDLIDSIVPNYIAGYIYGALIESYCSEQHSRMVAMKSANDSANKMLSALGIEFNRARQAAITQEINEVIGGVMALRRRKVELAERRNAK